MVRVEEVAADWSVVMASWLFCLRGRCRAVLVLLDL